MSEGFIKRNIEKLQVLKQGGDLFLRNWLPMVGYALIISVSGLLLVTPLSAWILNRLAARSGEFIVGNHELVGWLLSPTGLLYLLLVASVALMGLVLHVVGLIWIADSVGKKGFLRKERLSEYKRNPTQGPRRHSQPVSFLPGRIRGLCDLPIAVGHGDRGALPAPVERT